MAESAKELTWSDLRWSWRGAFAGFTWNMWRTRSESFQQSYCTLVASLAATDQSTVSGWDYALLANFLLALVIGTVMMAFAVGTVMDKFASMNSISAPFTEGGVVDCAFLVTIDRRAGIAVTLVSLKLWLTITGELLKRPGCETGVHVGGVAGLGQQLEFQAAVILRKSPLLHDLQHLRATYNTPPAMLSLKDHNLADLTWSDLTWSWPAGFAGFLWYMMPIGLDFVKKIYITLYEGPGGENDPAAKNAGYGQLINFVLQCLFVTLGTGFAVGTVDEKSTVSTDANRAVMGALVVVWAWSKVFGDSSWLSRMYNAMLRGMVG
nr:hypothetical protein B0A51_12237 [Rachicladosporium sp. CCFEE 5018]